MKLIALLQITIKKYMDLNIITKIKRIKETIKITLALKHNVNLYIHVQFTYRTKATLHNYHDYNNTQFAVTVPKCTHIFPQY